MSQVLVLQYDQELQVQLMTIYLKISFFLRFWQNANPLTSFASFDTDYASGIHFCKGPAKHTDKHTNKHILTRLYTV